MAKRKKPVFAVPVDQAAIEENPLLSTDEQINRTHGAWLMGVQMTGKKRAGQPYTPQRYAAMIERLKQSKMQKGNSK